MTAVALQRLGGFDFGFLRDKFEEEHPRHAPHFGEVVPELRRFFELVITSKKPIAVLSKEVDALWHTFVIHTPQYRQFCDQVNGGVHRPSAAFAVDSGSRGSHHQLLHPVSGALRRSACHLDGGHSSTLCGHAQPRRTPARATHTTLVWMDGSPSITKTARALLGRPCFAYYFTLNTWSTTPYFFASSAVI